LFADINDTEYKKYLPSNSVKDIEAIVLHLKNKNKYKNSRIFLLGGSEGTIIAPLAALNNNVRIDGLLLFGYCNENLKDTLTWQLSGNSELIYWL
jgi:pimeloyl-ACP methyl ester carboxylesterase